jgi:hypothetical protein
MIDDGYVLYSCIYLSMVSHLCVHNLLTKPPSNTDSVCRHTSAPISLYRKRCTSSQSLTSGYFFAAELTAGWCIGFYRPCYPPGVLRHAKGKALHLICVVEAWYEIAFVNRDTSRTVSSGMLRRVALVRTDVSEESTLYLFAVWVCC